MTVTSPTVKVEGDEEDDSISENIALHDIHRRSSMAATTTLASRMLVISGGDGYEDFRNNAANESAGRDDSTNHLLIWQVWSSSKIAAEEDSCVMWLCLYVTMDTLYSVFFFILYIESVKYFRGND